MKEKKKDHRNITIIYTAGKLGQYCELVNWELQRWLMAKSMYCSCRGSEFIF